MIEAPHRTKLKCIENRIADRLIEDVSAGVSHLVPRTLTNARGKTIRLDTHVQMRAFGSQIPGLYEEPGSKIVLDRQIPGSGIRCSIETVNRKGVGNILSRKGLKASVERQHIARGGVDRVRSSKRRLLGQILCYRDVGLLVVVDAVAGPNHRRTFCGRFPRQGQTRRPVRVVRIDEARPKCSGIRTASVRGHIEDVGEPRRNVKVRHVPVLLSKRAEKFIAHSAGQGQIRTDFPFILRIAYVLVLQEIVARSAVSDRTRLRISKKQISEIISGPGDCLPGFADLAGSSSGEAEGTAPIRIGDRAEVSPGVARPDCNAVRSF